MPNNSQYEDHSLQHKQSCYKPLSRAWKYSCPHKNINYSAFSNGTNCLCSGMPMARSTMDRSVISGKQGMWPVGNPSLGWRN